MRRIVAKRQHRNSRIHRKSPLTQVADWERIVRLSLNCRDAPTYRTLLMSYEPTNSDPVVCRCLGITQSEIRAAGDFGGCQTVGDVKELTEAGSGCTSCHRRIIALLQESRRELRAEAATSGGDSTAASLSETLR